MNIIIEATRVDGAAPASERNHDRGLLYASKIYQTLLRLVDIHRDYTRDTPVNLHLSPECHYAIQQIMKQVKVYRMRRWFLPMQALLEAFEAQQQLRELDLSAHASVSLGYPQAHSKH